MQPTRPPSGPESAPPIAQALLRHEQAQDGHFNLQRRSGDRPVKVAAAVAGYLLAFIALRHTYPRGILLYQGVALALVVSVALFLIEARHSAAVAAAKDGLLAFLLMYAFVFTVPTTVDRAYSVKLLRELEHRTDGMTSAEVAQWFSTEFLAGDAVRKRLHEQKVTGTIVEADGRQHLTAWGRFLAGSFRVTALAFACEAPR